MILDEKTLRKPDFSEGVKIRLADGAEWAFPKPTVQYDLAFTKAGIGFHPIGRHSFGMDFWELYDQWLQAEGFPEIPNALARLAVYLLRKNYTLDDEQLSALLPYVVDDPACSEMWSEIADVAGGRGPKATAAG